MWVRPYPASPNKIGDVAVGPRWKLRKWLQQKRIGITGHEWTNAEIRRVMRHTGVTSMEPAPLPPIDEPKPIGPPIPEPGPIPPVPEPPQPIGPPDSDEAITIRHAGGPWFEVVQGGNVLQKVKGREAAERIASSVQRTGAAEG